jgi:hypothetical protein
VRSGDDALAIDFGQKNAERRRERREPVADEVRFLTTRNGGVVEVAARMVEVSESGCRIIAESRLDPDDCGVLEVRGHTIPVVVRWANASANGWTAGCEFADRAHGLIP